MRTRIAVTAFAICFSLSVARAADNRARNQPPDAAQDGLSTSMQVRLSTSTPAEAIAAPKTLACASKRGQDNALRSEAPVTINCELFPTCPDVRYCDVECGLLELDSCYETSLGSGACCFVEGGAFYCPSSKVVTAVTCDCENCPEGSLQLTCR